MDLRNGDCLELMKSLPDKSVDLMICDLPYGETICKWDTKLDMVQFWEQFKRIRKSKRTACIHFCSTKFGYSLIKSNEKMFKMDMVWKKRNKTGGLQSRNRPMRNHEMVYFFYEQAPQYNRDTYHKRIQAKPAIEKNKTIKSKDRKSMGESSGIYTKENQTGSSFDPPNPASVVEEHEIVNYKTKSSEIHERTKAYMSGSKQGWKPLLPASVISEESIAAEPVSMFESTKVFIGKRHHQTEKPLDILEFFIKYWSDEGQTILDPTMGSGSTGVACKTLKRNFIGFEMDENIFKVAEGRIEKIII